MIIVVLCALENIHELCLTKRYILDTLNSQIVCDDPYQLMVFWTIRRIRVIVAINPKIDENIYVYRTSGQTILIYKIMF